MVGEMHSSGSQVATWRPAGRALLDCGGHPFPARHGLPWQQSLSDDTEQENPKPFIWTAKAADVLEKVTRAPNRESTALKPQSNRDQTAINKRRSA